ncbi:MAG: acetate--CoA ligase family protein [Chloroflexi bacterium]|nr:acetate--CoA ligase family protein [Chloroflexota bacterium]
MNNPLLPFLNPQSVAMFGVSPNWSYINTILKDFIAFKNPARVYPINPNYPEVEGLKCYARLTDIEDSVDLAMLSVPARLIPDALEQCAIKRVKGVNIITSGFEEMGGDEGAQRHQWLADFVHATGIRIVGPNCFGNLSSVHKFPGMPASARALQRAGRLSMALQSGGLAISTVSACVDRYIGLAHVVSTGNEADVEIGDCLEFFADDENTQVIGLYVEQFRNPKKFLRAAELCADKRKPIVLLKTGRTDAGRQMALAHTGALAGSDAIIDAVCKKFGIARVYSLNEMLETMCILHSRKMPQGKGIGAVTNSGGASAIIADEADALGLQFPQFAAASYKHIRATLYDYITVTNPLDITGPGGVTDQHIHKAALEALGMDPNIHIILYQLGANARIDGATPGGKVLLNAMKQYPEKIWVKVMGYAGTFRDKALNVAEIIEPVSDFDGVPFLMSFDNSLRAVKALLEYAEFQEKRDKSKVQSPMFNVVGHLPPDRGHRTPDDKRKSHAFSILSSAQGRALTETEGKKILALYEIPVTKEKIATNADDAARAAKQIGFPIAMKIVSPDIAHKTEAGGVALNIASARAARAAYSRIMNHARKYNARADLRGVSVQEMISGGREMIVGMTHDAQFGPAIILGLGGIFVEVLKDVAMRVPPLSSDDARAMIESLKGAAILRGARGQTRADVDALADTLMKFSILCLELRGAVKEIDINPLVVLDEGCGVKAVDCLVIGH